MFHRHKHKWISVACSSNYEKHFLQATGKEGKVTVTKILQRCICGDLRTREIDGSWTAAELGINDETVHDLLVMLNEIRE